MGAAHHPNQCLCISSRKSWSFTGNPDLDPITASILQYGHIAVEPFGFSSSTQ